MVLIAALDQLLYEGFIVQCDECAYSEPAESRYEACEGGPQLEAPGASPGAWRCLGWPSGLPLQVDDERTLGDETPKLKANEFGQCL